MIVGRFVWEDASLCFVDRSGVLLIDQSDMFLRVH